MTDDRPSAPCGICGHPVHWSPEFRLFVHVETEDTACPVPADQFGLIPRDAIVAP